MVSVGRRYEGAENTGRAGGIPALRDSAVDRGLRSLAANGSRDLDGEPSPRGSTFGDRQQGLRAVAGIGGTNYPGNAALEPGVDRRRFSRHSALRAFVGPARSGSPAKNAGRWGSGPLKRGRELTGF